MLDDDFEKIEDFLKSQEGLKSEVSLEIKFLQRFEAEIITNLKESFDFSGDKAKENMLRVHQALMQAYQEFGDSQELTIKCFSISLVLIKNTLEKLKEIKENSPLKGEEKAVYLLLMKTLIDALQKECTENINHFQAFLDYINNSIAPISVEN